MSNRVIGGYFELELPKYEAFHPQAIALNGGRFCLEYLLRCCNLTKIYLPYFACDTILQPISRLGIAYEFYHIDREFRLIEAPRLMEDEALLYINYWGLCDDYCRELYGIYGRKLILDYTQAFFAKPIPGVDTFYSCRKFFGVPDGGYLYTERSADFEIEADCSLKRVDSLLKRIDLSPEEGYEDFRKISESFREMAVCHMSKFTRRMMSGIDYEEVIRRRRANYETLRRALGGEKLAPESVPMVFPYPSEKGQELRKHLIANRIFVAKYWPGVEERVDKACHETWLANHLLPLPIDQRYEEEDMRRIIRKIQEYEE